MGMEAYQNRRSDKEGIEDFPTQPWATRAFCEHVIQLLDSITSLTNKVGTAWEPAANRGYMVRPLQEYFGTVIASDLEDYGVGYPQIDFLTGPTPSDFGMDVDWIITNPPFNLALDFAKRALEPGMSKRGVALFVRSSWIEGITRYNKLFSVNPPSIIAQYVERVPIVRGRVQEKAATAMPYCWFVWDHQLDTGAPEVWWIPPCRDEMKRDGDYDVVGVPADHFYPEENADDDIGSGAETVD